MPALGVEGLRAALGALESDLALEVWRAEAGLGPAADLPAVFARHAEATGPDAGDLVRELAADEGRRTLAAWGARLIGRRAGAEAEARTRVWAGGSVVRAPGGAAVPFREVDEALAVASGDRAARLALDGARTAGAGAEYAPLVRERWARERDAVEALGVANGYLATWGRVEGEDVTKVVDAATAFLRETAAAWQDAHADVVKRRLGVPPTAVAGGVVGADLPVLLSDPTLDALLPAGAALVSVRIQAAAMGLDAAAGGRVRFDIGARPGQRPGAWCTVVRVPWEVRVTARPRPGVMGWQGVLAAIGCAIAAAHADSDVSAEMRVHAGRTLRAAIAQVWQALLADDGWLRRYAGLTRERASAVRRQAAFTALYSARCDAALLRLTVQLADGVVPTSDASEAAVATMVDAIGVRIAGDLVAVPFSPWLAVADRARAVWIGASLRAELRERFDDDWWRNPRSGPWLQAHALAPSVVPVAPATPVEAVREAERGVG